MEKAPQSAFNLWFQENKETIKTQNPKSKTAAALQKVALQQFSKLQENQDESIQKYISQSEQQKKSIKKSVNKQNKQRGKSREPIYKKTLPKNIKQEQKEKQKQQEINQEEEEEKIDDKDNSQVPENLEEYERNLNPYIDKEKKQYSAIFLNESKKTFYTINILQTSKQLKDFYVFQLWGKYKSGTSGKLQGPFDFKESNKLYEKKIKEKQKECVSLDLSKAKENSVYTYCVDKEQPINGYFITNYITIPICTDYINKEIGGDQKAN